jgi:uncharacterized membrane protein YccC
MASRHEITSRGQDVSPEATSATHPSAWTAFWQSVVAFQRQKLNPWVALRNTIGVTIPLALGAALGDIVSALVVTTGALNVSFSDSQEPYRRRASRMIVASVLVGLAVFLGTLSGNRGALAVAIATCWALAAGMLVALSTAAADLGTISLVSLVVYAANPLPLDRAMHAGLLAFGGGILQTSLSLALWPLRRYAAERRALGDLYLALSRAAEAPVRATEAPPATAETTQAQAVLGALDRDHSLDAERYRLLLSQAERIRLSLMLLGRLRIRIGRESRAPSDTLDRYFEMSSQMLASIGNSLLASQVASAVPECLHELQGYAEALRQVSSPEHSPLAAMLRDARWQMDALTGQLRAACDLAAYATPAGIEAFDRREASRPWRLRLGGTLATLRANLNLDSAACRHAVRLAVCVGIGDALARGLDLRRSYWLPMTVAIVLKPDFGATFSRGVLRLAGTFVGLIFATVLFHFLPANLAVQVALMAALMFALRWVGPANYGILVITVTALVVLLIAAAGVSPREVIAARGLNTALGGVIALLAYSLWPTWERTQIREVMAGMLDAYRDYFRAIRENYQDPGRSFAEPLDRARAAARLARSNLEASIDRLSSEPGTSAVLVRKLGAMLASSHRLVHAIMALEAGLSSSHPVPARDAFRSFADHVELILYHLAAALRGSPLARADLPDLREDHHALVRSGDPLTERYALVNVETDRITNSLNTFTEELLSWIDPAPVASPRPVA